MYAKITTPTMTPNLWPTNAKRRHPIATLIITALIAASIGWGTRAAWDNSAEATPQIAAIQGEIERLQTQGLADVTTDEEQQAVFAQVDALNASLTSTP